MLRTVVVVVCVCVCMHTHVLFQDWWKLQEEDGSLRF